MSQVSVVVPALDEEENIGRLLESLENQTLPPDEVIVVDNSSTDRTAEIAREYGAKVFVVSREASKGQLRNIGTQRAEGSMILSTDADCIPKRNWVEEMTRHFQDKNVLAVTGGIEDTQGQRLENFIAKNAVKIYRGLGANTAFRKEIWERVGGYNHNITAEDIDFFKKIRDIGKTVVTDHTMPTKIEGLKWGFLPVILASGVAGTIGYLIKDRNKVLGNTLIYGSMGAISGEVGHHIIHSSGFEEITPHHDQLALAGLGITALFDFADVVPESWRTFFYSFFGVLFVHHVITEGSFINHCYRWALGE